MHNNVDIFCAYNLRYHIRTPTFDMTHKGYTAVSIHAENHGKLKIYLHIYIIFELLIYTYQITHCNQPLHQRLFCFDLCRTR